MQRMLIRRMAAAKSRLLCQTSARTCPNLAPVAVMEGGLDSGPPLFRSLHAWLLGHPSTPGERDLDVHPQVIEQLLPSARPQLSCFLPVMRLNLALQPLKVYPR